MIDIINLYEDQISKVIYENNLVALYDNNYVISGNYKCTVFRNWEWFFITLGGKINN